jgi:hypothetical protein
MLQLPASASAAMSNTLPIQDIRKGLPMATSQRRPTHIGDLLITQFGITSV